MEYKAIIIDLDGTILDDNKNISNENANIIRELFNKGIRIVIATGRGYLFAKIPLEKIDFSPIILANNGNSTWDMKEDKKISSIHIDYDVYFRILEMGHKKDLHPVLHVDLFDEGIDFVTEFPYKYNAYNNYLKNNTKRHRVMSDLKDRGNLNVMVMCYPGDIATIKSFQKDVNDVYSQHIHSHIAYSLKSVGTLLEISHIKGTKWYSAQNLLRAFGLKSEEAIAIGNDSNDITMIESAGLGIAMKNAIEDVKKKAGIITEYDNNNSGVARVLKKIFF